MKLDENGYKLIMGFEGLSLVPYLCSAKVPTIGYGSTFYPSGKKVTMQDKPINLETAKWMLKETANIFATQVNLLVKTKLTQNQFNALVSFAFNLGSQALSKSTLLKKVNINPNDITITNEFLKWNKAGGVALSGLTKRRTIEAKLYFTK
jgi:lysozyme